MLYLWPTISLLVLVNAVIGELLSVHIIFRHGHRKPLEGYARSPNHDWNESGGLTDVSSEEIKVE